MRGHAAATGRRRRGDGGHQASSAAREATGMVRETAPSLGRRSPRCAPVGLDERPGDGDRGGPAAAAHPVELLEIARARRGQCRPAVGHETRTNVALGARRDDDGRILGSGGPRCRAGWRTLDMSTWSLDERQVIGELAPTGLTHGGAERLERRRRRARRTEMALAQVSEPARSGSCQEVCDEARKLWTGFRSAQELLLSDSSSAAPGTRSVETLA